MLMIYPIPLLPASDNYIHDNGDAGIALMESFGAEIYDNKIENCKYGIRFSLGSANNDIHDNTFDSSSSCESYEHHRRILEISTLREMTAH